jgi:hypothetical protein
VDALIGVSACVPTKDVMCLYMSLSAGLRKDKFSVNKSDYSVTGLAVVIRSRDAGKTVRISVRCHHRRLRSPLNRDEEGNLPLPEPVKRAIPASKSPGIIQRMSVQRISR